MHYIHVGMCLYVYIVYSAFPLTFASSKCPFPQTDREGKSIPLISAPGDCFSALPTHFACFLLSRIFLDSESVSAHRDRRHHPDCTHQLLSEQIQALLSYCILKGKMGTGTKE